jgi:hypothetical protein
VCVLTGVGRHAWISPYLALNLLTLAQDTRFNVQIEPVIDKCPVDYARNFCVAMARERKADWLFFIDNDQSFEINPLDVLAGAKDKSIIGLPSMQAGRDSMYPNFRTLEQPEKDGEFFTVSHIGTGAMFINRRVWEKIPGPWFKTNQAEDELRTPHAHGEDYAWCELAQQHGFKVWSHNRLILHWKTCEVTRLGQHLESLRQRSGSAEPVQWGKKRA